MFGIKIKCSPWFLHYFYNPIFTWIFVFLIFFSQLIFTVYFIFLYFLYYIKKIKNKNRKRWALNMDNIFKKVHNRNPPSPPPRCPQTFDPRERAAGKLPEETLPPRAFVPHTDSDCPGGPCGGEPRGPSSSSSAALPTRCLRSWAIARHVTKVPPTHPICDVG